MHVSRDWNIGDGSSAMLDMELSILGGLWGVTGVLLSVQVGDAMRKNCDGL